MTAGGNDPAEAQAKVIVLTGKGGVGKTTVAAATAATCAAAGLRTVVVSADPAHSLADVFAQALGSDPTPIDANLWGQQLDAQRRLEESWGSIQTWLVEVFNWAGAEGIEAEELAVLPGLDELFVLTDIESHATSGDYDVVVVDCGPTAETLRLLSLPSVLSRYVDRVFPVGRRLNKMVSPVLGRLTDIPLADDDVFISALALYERLTEVQALLTDPQRTRVRLVVNAEQLVIAETRRTHTYLSLFGYEADAVVVNKLYPDSVTDPFLESWHRLQAERLTDIESGFAPLPILKADLVGGEVVGCDSLKAFGADLFAGIEPWERLHDGQRLEIVADGDGAELRVPLPFAERDQLELNRLHDDLLVRIGTHKRAIALPDSLKRRSVTSASLDDSVLAVSFGPSRSPRARAAI
jgi:arsenite-transporting ATPase